MRFCILKSREIYPFHCRPGGFFFKQSHPITAHEVKNGVNMDALKFDDLYRKQGAIIMEVID